MGECVAQASPLEARALGKPGAPVTSAGADLSEFLFPRHTNHTISVS